MMDERQLWRTGSFVCEVRLMPDLPFPAVLCILKDNEPVVEVPVLSTIEMEERAHGLRALVERYHTAAAR